MFARTAVIGAFLVGSFGVLQAQTFQLLKVQTGPSGKTVGSTFVFDEIRNRFIYPQDRSLIVHFAWNAPVGEHVLTATWIGPNGRANSISPDVKIQNTGPEMQAYWTFQIMPDAPGGVWSCEVKIDGEPAGSTAFEVVMPAQAPVQVQPKPEHPKMDQLYKRLSASVVWVYAVTQAGSRVDTSMGFILDKGRVATSFDAIDSAKSVEIELPSGARLSTDKVIACSRLQNWAVLAADTGDAPPVEIGDPAGLAVGQQVLVFNVDHENSRLFGGANIVGAQSSFSSQQRFLLDGQLTPRASGAPVLDRDGKVIGFLASGVVPAARFPESAMSATPALWSGFGDVFAIPISAIQVPASAAATSFEQIASAGVLTRPLTPGVSFLWGGTTDQPVKNDIAPPRYVSTFRRDQTVWVEMLWAKNGKVGKGIIGAELFSPDNRLLARMPPKKLRLNNSVPSRVSFSFPVASLAPGIYRLDVLWGGAPVWRTFVQVAE